MSLVTTYHEPLLEQNGIYKTTKSTRQRIQDIIRSLLDNQSELLVQVELGKATKQVLETEIIKILDDQGGVLDRDQLIRDIFDEMFGYGQLQRYLEDEEVSDIIGSQYDCFYCKKNGQVFSIPVAFENELDFENYCKLIIIRNGGLINENDNHARVADESLRLRINVTIAPRAVNGPCLSIRKHRRRSLSLVELKDRGMIDQEALNMIRSCLLDNSRFLICGKGAAGKTTLLRALLNEVGHSQRILICEADTEIYPESPTMMVQKIIARESFGKSVKLTDLIRDGLTMSLDGYCIGEITGPEAWDFIQAGYTDHRIFGTLHSNSAEEAPWRLMMLANVSQLGMTDQLVMRMICESLDYIVYMKAFQVEKVVKIESYDDMTQKAMFKSVYERSHSIV